MTDQSMIPVGDIAVQALAHKTGRSEASVRQSLNALPDAKPKGAAARARHVKGDPIAVAIANIMGEIGGLEKAGFNKEQKYNFAKASDLAEKVQPLFAEHGLILHQHEVEASQMLDGAFLVCTYDFIWQHVSGAKSASVRQSGGCRFKFSEREGKVSFDDKAVNKCHTAARKYFLIGALQIPTGEVSDADNDPAPREDAQERRAGPPRSSPPRSAQPRQEAVQQRQPPDSGEPRHGREPNPLPTGEPTQPQWQRINQVKNAITACADMAALDVVRLKIIEEPSVIKERVREAYTEKKAALLRAEAEKGAADARPSTAPPAGRPVQQQAAAKSAAPAQTADDSFPGDRPAATWIPPKLAGCNGVMVLNAELYMASLENFFKDAITHGGVRTETALQLLWDKHLAPTYLNMQNRPNNVSEKMQDMYFRFVAEIASGR